ncbi:hypothetical protein [Mycobacterium deserti]|uniref:Secreted protein n=1 Tax=Mycobacterium deserti TaxID=2978347 RepID=A0ABT2M7K7_9MYCO|nr:hypothetical protein [Mycobacterium deserti]MCT7657150.1 hypothetical protein [Mycobacterium deserti]
MIRCLTLTVSMLAAAVTALGAGPATAQPTTEPAPEPSCVYTLSEPSLVSVSGVLMVTASLAPFPCTGSINPNSMTVCVSPKGDAGNGKCGFASRSIPAQVFLTPYRPGTTYESTGRGCGGVYTLVGAICATVGPKTATL